jgi:hypothetical protein
MVPPVAVDLERGRLGRLSRLGGDLRHGSADYRFMMVASGLERGEELGSKEFGRLEVVVRVGR